MFDSISIGIINDKNLTVSFMCLSPYKRHNNESKHKVIDSDSIPTGITNNGSKHT
jgi:hypothetical protein